MTKKLARKFGRKVTAVRRRRVEKGIPDPDGKVRRWTSEDDRILGTRPDEQIALLLGISVHAVRNRRRLLGLRRNQLR